MNNNDVPEGIEVVSDTPIPKFGRKKNDKKNDWESVKRDYLMNPTKTLEQVGAAYGIPKTTIYNRSFQEGWAKQKDILYVKVDQRAKDMQVERLAALATRQALMGRFLQKTGIEAIKNKKVHIKSAKDALEFTVAGVRMEREAEGLDKQTPQIVNIVAHQQGVIDKYKQ